MFIRIPEEVVNNVRKANDIVDVIGEYVQLKKQGRNYVGLCPFHDEKTPSFSVAQDKQMFYCFGCKKGGNVMNFLMELEGYSFQESLTFLANKSGLELPATTKKQETALSRENQNILSAYEWLTKLYHHLLRYTKDGKEGYEYFKDRGISEETIDTFQLGFAPNVKDFTAEFLEKKGFHRQLLIKAGLLSLQDDNSVTDRFRGRVIFPIRNHLGKPIAFGGRTIFEQDPKYLNSSESELFQKNRLLYNFDLAKRHIRKEETAILFEGQMDVISAYQAGIKNVVATLGTSLTENQAKLLKRYVDTVIICYDPDSAGNEASFKAATLLRQTGCQVKIANLQHDMDPDSYIKKYGSKTFKNDVIKASDTFISFYMRFLKKDFNLSIEGDRIQYIKTILKELAMVESSIEREYYLKDLSSEYNLSINTLKEEVATLRHKTGFHKDKREKNRYTSRTTNFHFKNKLLPAYHNAERQLIAHMLQDALIADRVRKEIGVNFHLDDHKVIVTHLYAFYEDGKSADPSMFIERLTEERLKQLVIEISMTPIFENISEQEINDYIRIIRTQIKDMTSINDFREQQRIAEQQNDPIKAAQIAMQIIEIHKQSKQTK